MKKLIEVVDNLNSKNTLLMP